MLKRITKIFLILYVFFLFTTCCMAAVDQSDKQFNVVTPLWTYITQFNNTLSISTTGKAEIESCLYSFDSDELQVVAELQQLSNGIWTTIKSWESYSASISCSVSEAWYVEAGHYYRLVSTGTVYISGMPVEQSQYIGQEKWY